MPLLLFSVLAAIGGSFALSLPETLNCKLPDTVLEAEALGMKKTAVMQKLQEEELQAMTAVKN